MSRILVIDDEPGICRAFERFFKGKGHSARTASRAETGITLAEAYEPDVILLDIRLPGMSGLDALLKLRGLDPSVPVVVMTAYGTMDTAVLAMKRGAYDYVLKPIDLARISAVVGRALEGRKIAAEADTGPALKGNLALSREGSLPVLVGRTAGMQEVFKRIGAVSDSDTCVLITGESGTGKEMVARGIHNASPRAGRSFERVSCGALPEDLLHCELFGVAPGVESVPGARRTGRVESAEGGTIFLEDVSEMPASVQVRLLELLEEGRYEPTGGDETRPGDVRIISSSGQGLEELVRAGRFREDVFYRLNVMTIEVPPLRERLADIPVLAAMFLGTAGTDSVLSKEALRILVTHSWPGNVRELRSAVEHALVLARGGAVLPEHLPDTVRSTEQSGARDESEQVRGLVDSLLSGDLPEGELFANVMDRFEAPLIAAILSRTDGNQVRAAKVLGIHRTTLRSKIKKHGL